MIWIDITDPKYALFFHQLLPFLKKIDSLLITTRWSNDYTECLDLLKLLNIKAQCVGGYGGSSKIGKLESRIQRQMQFLKLFEKKIPKLFITGVSVEGTHTAHALGIPIIQFSDTPIIGHEVKAELLSKVARLTLPLSSFIFHPFLVPKECFTLLGLKTEQLHSYPFIDVAIWLKNLNPQQDFREILHIPTHRPTILAREEEYKAHYVEKKLDVFYKGIELLAKLNVNIILMPRYGEEELKIRFGKLENVYISHQRFHPAQYYPYIDLLLGGGGSMNLEACYLGIPTLSVRSLFLFHDIYLIQKGLMKHAKTPGEVLELSKKLLLKGRRPLSLEHRKIFERSLELNQDNGANFEQIAEKIQKIYNAIEQNS